ncbi:MAG: hypothetical protein HQL51_08805, partial [Magnetococcales bacterium]|nr:hypothetical protein [Magnetococcales bacterium]
IAPDVSRVALRTFRHLAKPDDPFLRKAEAALWEWESHGEAEGTAAGGREGEGVPAAESLSPASSASEVPGAEDLPVSPHSRPLTRQTPG